VSGEGCFTVDINQFEGKRITSINFRFFITQHSRDELLMKSLVDYLSCGYFYKKGTDQVEYRVYKFSDIAEKIIPFFLKHKIIGVKLLDFQD
jgi:hypothetical protein